MKKKITENAEYEVAKATSDTNEDEKVRELLKMKLATPYKFDGKEISELDLGGIMDLTARDLVELDTEMQRRGFYGSRTEMSRQYAMLVAAKVMDKPYNFCDGMSARDSIRLKETITTFFFINV